MKLIKLSFDITNYYYKVITNFYTFNFLILTNLKMFEKHFLSD